MTPERESNHKVGLVSHHSQRKFSRRQVFLTENQGALLAIHRSKVNLAEELKPWSGMILGRRNILERVQRRGFVEYSKSRQIEASVDEKIR